MAQAFFEVFITTVKKEHGLVKMYGQPDPQTGEVVRKYLAAVVPQLEGGSPPTADKVNIKQSVIARYDGGWYRAQVLAISGQKYTMYFVDYGNVNDVTLADIRIGLHSQLNQISPQVYPFYLADVVPPARDWSKPSMEFIEDALVNVLCRCIVVRRVKGYCFIRIFKPDSSDPFINDLVHCGMAVLGNPNMDLVPSLEQRQLAPMTSRPPLGYPPMLPPGSMGPPSPNFPTSLSPQPPMFPTQRVSPQPHHSFPPPGPPPIQPVLPTHHASHPRLQSLNPSLPRGLMHGQHPNDLSGIRMNRDSHTRQQHSRINHLPVQPLGRGSLVGNRVPGPHLDRTVRFRPMQLEEDKWHEVVLSSWDGGPTDFCIQLKSSSKHLRDLMDTISQRDQLIPMNPHQIDGGKPCLAMSKADNTIYRAAVLKRDKHLAKVYFLDYGITENLPLELIYNISDMHIKPRILSVRCRLSQWPDLPPNNKALAKSRFEHYADRQLGCKIVTSESERQGSTFLTKTEVQLFDEAGNDIGAEIKLLLSLRPQEGVDVPSIAPTFRDNLSVSPSYSFAELPRKAEVYLSFPGTGPNMFFVQLSDCTDRLDPLMEEIAQLMRGGPRTISSPMPGMPCAAKFSDGVWYRAQVENVFQHQSKVQVYFVDYGNSEAVNYNAVSSIPDRLVSQLPAQAVRCKLVGPCEERDNVSRAVLEAFENLLNPDSPFSVIVEKKIQNVHYLQMDVPSINDWPEELKEKLFSKFHPSDLGAALLVCRTWKRLGEQPKLWEWINLKVTQRNVAAMPQILAMERLKTQKEIHIFAVSEELLKAINSHLALKTLHVKCSISSADPALLARVIHKMEEAHLDKAKLTPQQVQAVFNFFGCESKLRKLCMSFTDLSAVDPQVLARAVTMLEEVDIERSHLNDEQCQTIFQFLDGESKLKVLNIGVNDLHSVQPEVLARAIVKLEVIGLTYARLTAQQCQQVFQSIGRESQLKKLDIQGNYLSSVRPELLAEAIVKLDEVVLYDTALTPEQCQSIIKVASYGSKMRKLSIEWNDLTSVDPDVLARVAVKLEEVSLEEATLTADQHQTIIKLASSNFSKLKKVTMMDNDLSPVDPEELAKAVSKLEEVEFIGVKLTVVQCQAIFELASSDSSKLNRVCIAHTDLSSAAPEALAKAVSKLEEARFAHAKLTPQQSQAMFKIASGESKLKILNMEGNDLSSVDPKTLGKVIHKMEDVNLRGTKLTNEQCQAIFEVASCESKLKKIKMCRNNLSFMDPESLGKVLNEVEVAWLTSTQLTSLQCETIIKFVLGDTKLMVLCMAGNDFSKVNPETLDEVEAKFKYFKSWLID